jgi:hypothetical protein
MMARFSTVAGEPGSADTERDMRGFALKFYIRGRQPESDRQQFLEVIIIPHRTTRQKLQTAIGEKHGQKN